MVPTKILHIITTLDRGGAETALYRLLSETCRERFAHRVICLSKPGIVAQEIRELGWPVESLYMKAGKPSIAAFGKMIRLINRWKPRILQTWMYHSDLLGTAALFGNNRTRLIWSIRCAEMDLARYSPVTRLIRRLCVFLSKRPDAVIANSMASVDYHTALGYRPKRFDVIPNGFDLTTFRPDDVARREVRSHFDIPDGAPCIGMVARFDTMKDHLNFFTATGQIHPHHPELFYLFCGEGVDEKNPVVVQWLKKFPGRGKVRLLGPRRDIPRIMAAVDVLVLSSKGESFPNVVGEAMATQVPCVVTDVGDSAAIVGDTGTVVAPCDAAALARGIVDMLRKSKPERKRLGEMARERIQRKFSLDRMVADYQHLYTELVRIPGKIA